MRPIRIIGIVAALVAVVGCGRRRKRMAQQSPQEKLIAKIAAQTDMESLGPQSGTIEDFRRFVEEQAKNPKPAAVVSLEDFFEGNQDEGSIGCNIIPYPGLDQFYGSSSRFDQETTFRMS